MIKAWQSFWAARSRRQEKARKSRQIESTFAERLGSGRSKATSKIDIGFTSQPNLNSEEQPKRRQTFSRFFQLLNGLRNSKRKTNAEDSRRSVVFTIQTEDIFPKCTTKQQTEPSDDHSHVIEMQGAVHTQLCADIHKEKTTEIEEYNNDNMYVNETADGALEKRAGIKEIENKTCHSSGDEEEKIEVNTFTNGLENSSSSEVLSKESDIDSGIGSSYHEMNNVEVHQKYLPLTVNTLISSDGLRNEINIKDTSETDISNGEDTLLCAGHQYVNNESEKVKADSENISSIDCLQHDMKENKYQQVAVDEPFQALIQLAKQGMSNEAQGNEYLSNNELNNKHININLTGNEIETNDCLRQFHGMNINKGGKTKDHKDTRHDDNSERQTNYREKVAANSQTDCASSKTKTEKDILLHSELIKEKHVSPAIVSAKNITSSVDGCCHPSSVQCLLRENEPSSSQDKMEIISQNKEQGHSQTKNHIKKMASLEDLNLPSQTSPDKRPRSFSSTVRRKLSIRSQSTSDDIHMMSRDHIAVKSKKFKAFGSFRLHSSRKNKSTSNEPRTSDLNELSKGYTCTFDKIFSEDSELPVFSDVPFTIPEISD